MILGITGFAGSGKTAAARIFSRHHFSVIDADEIGHRILDEDPLVHEKIVGKFGSEVLAGDDSIDRRKLGDIVFGDEKKLKLLNSIIHPLIIEEIKNQIGRIRRKRGNDAKIIVDAPLLLETGARNLVEKIVVVKAGKGKILKRLSRSYPREKIEKILKSQMPTSEKLRKADFVIDNSKDIIHLEKQVKKIVSLTGSKK